MSQVGRISGPLLTANLERNGINLAFRNTTSDTQLLFLDVNSGKIGVNKGVSSHELDVNSNIRSTNLISDTISSIANYTIENNNLNVLVGDINLNAADAIKLSNFETDNIHISDNVISTYQSNANIDLKPFGAGLPPNDGVVTSTLLGGEAFVQKVLPDQYIGTGEPTSATWQAIQTFEPGDIGIITFSGVDYPFTVLSWEDSLVYRDVMNIDAPTIPNFVAGWWDNSITIRPITYKTTEIINDLEVIGNLNATGNITADGNIVIGDSDTDNVTLNADIGNDIVPATTNTYALGSNTKRWNNLYTNLVNGQSVVVSELIASGGGDFSKRQGNIFFVSVNGNDANGGDNVQSPFLTIKRALQAADSSVGGPVTIQVFAGEYQEELPLTVPSNVSVIGVDMRNTIITPDTNTQSSDVFLLNGESTIQNLTIKNFYAPGYAFKFAPNAIISTRSPYIQNVTVITQGTTTSASDPRGFDSGDAGGGAYIDGASVNSLSNEASMLFHSVTFITPGVDAVTMTNGVRVEWLNSFTYFANRGLYAVDGVTGHLSTDGSTVKYGAEIRSIGSANVYGNYGAVADGADTLMYLIQHNFGYIGAGKDVTNDPTLAIQANEVVKLNSGRIYYQSVDHFGNFRVGDQFFIDQESGSTSIVLTEAEVDSLNGLVITTNQQTSIINGEKIDLGDFTIAGNTINTITQDFNVDSAGTINFTSDVAIANNLTMTGDITIGGTLVTLGNQSTDTVNFNTPFSQNIEPDVSGLYNLGSPSKKWIKGWFGAANVSDIEFNENYISTTVSNADLDIRANGTGEILVPNNNVQINNNLTVNSNTFLNGGSYYTTPNIDLTLTLDNPNAYGTSAADQFGFSVAISSNYAIVGAWLEDDAGGTTSGKAYIFNVTTGSLLHTLDNPNAYGTSNADRFGQSVAISGNYAIVGAWSEDDAIGNDSGKAYIFNVTTGSLLHTLDNPNAYGTSNSDSFGYSVAIGGNYAIVGVPYEDDAGGSSSGKAYIYNVTTGALVHTLDNPNAYDTSNGDYFGGSVAISGNYAIVGVPYEDDAGGGGSGKAYIFDVTTGSLIHTLDNPNAYGTSLGDYFGQSVAISGNYAIVGAWFEDDAVGDSSGKAYIFDVTTGALLHTLDNPNAYSASFNDQFGYSVAISGNYAIVSANEEDDAGGGASGKAYIFDVATGALLLTLDNPNAYSASALDRFGYSVGISGNYAIVSAPGEDDAGGSGSGKSYIFQFTDPTLIVDPTDVNITGTLLQTGDTTISNDLNVTGAAHITGLLDVGAKAQLENILIDGNLITTTASNSDLDLRASSTGNINIPNNDVVVSNAFTVRDITGTDLVVQTSVALNEIITSSQIVIDDNFITTSLSNSDLELRANGTGGIQIQDDMLFNQNVISTTQDLNFTVGGNLNITSNSALLLSNGDDLQRVNNAAGNIRFSTQDNVFEGYGIAPIGFGGVYSADRRTNIFAHPTNDTINITVNNLAVGQVNSGGIEIHGLQTDDVNINANVISTSVSNSDLELVRNGLGRIVVGDTIFKNNQIINNNPSSGLILTNTANGYVKFAGTGAVSFPSGNNTTERGTANQIGDARWNETDGYMEVWDGTNWITAQGGGETVTQAFMEELLGEWSLILG